MLIFFAIPYELSVILVFYLILLFGAIICDQFQNSYFVAKALLHQQIFISVIV